MCTSDSNLVANNVCQLNLSIYLLIFISIFVIELAEIMKNLRLVDFVFDFKFINLYTGIMKISNLNFFFSLNILEINCLFILL